MLVHDFMAEDDLTGPSVAASFMLVSLSFDPGTVCLTPSLVGAKLSAAGFGDVTTHDLIPGITKLTTAVKLARRRAHGLSSHAVRCSLRGRGDRPILTI